MTRGWLSEKVTMGGAARPKGLERECPSGKTDAGRSRDQSSRAQNTGTGQSQGPIPTMTWI